MTVTEYEREFVRLSKYARKYSRIERIFRVSRESLQLAKKKRKANIESHDSRKRQLGKSFQSSSKKSREFTTQSVASKRFSNRSIAQTTSIASVGNARANRSECSQCGRRHPGECRANERACFKCGSQDYFIRDCPEMVEKEKFQSARSGSTTRGRLQKNPGNGMSSKNMPRESEGRAPARTYAICAREEASSPNVITGTFSLYDIHVVTLIDPGSTHSYIYVKLVSSMNMPIESTEFVIKMSNPLGKCVLVDKVCKDCLLMIRGHYFPANLMLLSFDEFDAILGIDWLTVHDVTVNCGRKYIELKCENGDTFCVKSDEQDRLPLVISFMSALKYIRKGYEAYLAFVMNSKESELIIESVPIVCEYPAIFPEELLGLPSVREIEFGIELASVLRPF
ncbi:Gag-Pol polyprotein [Gossypium australe]|uniref:Gag-Pol polyprotein n=1 Tax=Gossypium australe TaxID=47621 RepID=A0A5B6WQB5_9ROSI|nr:Gag-Pol polyprotein [Gossypium australe]